MSAVQHDVFYNLHGANEVTTNLYFVLLNLLCKLATLLSYKMSHC